MLLAGDERTETLDGVEEVGGSPWTPRVDVFPDSSIRIGDKCHEDGPLLPSN